MIKYGGWIFALGIIIYNNFFYWNSSFINIYSELLHLRARVTGSSNVDMKDMDMVLKANAIIAAQHPDFARDGKLLKVMREDKAFVKIWTPNATGWTLYVYFDEDGNVLSSEIK